MSVYSISNIVGTLSGPGISVQLGFGAGLGPDDAIEVQYNESASNQTIGSDGAGMISLNANRSGTLTLRYLQTSPINGALNEAFNAQTASSTLMGQNIISFRDVVRDERVFAEQVSFTRLPGLKYGSNAGVTEWELSAVRITITRSQQV